MQRRSSAWASVRNPDSSKDDDEVVVDFEAEDAFAGACSRAGPALAECRGGARGALAFDPVGLLQLGEQCSGDREHAQL